MKKLAGLLASLLAALSLVVPANAADTAAHGYVAFGDSIAFGYGLSSVQTQCFTNLTAKELDLPFNNYAVNGMTSLGLLQTLQSLLAQSVVSETYKNLTSASVITVTIGSNDLLGKLTAIWSSVTSARGGVLDAETFAMLEAALTSESALASFEEGIASYQENLPAIFDILRASNHDAQIIMTKFYNPYYGVTLGSFDFSAMCDQYITAMNDILTAGAETMDYTIADSYTPFNAPKMTNVDMETANFDPHPNIDGHIAIRDAVLAVVDREAIAAMNEVVTEATATEAPTESETSAETTAAIEEKQSEKFPIGVVALVGIAVVAFGITGVVITKTQNKSKKK